jgi:hypothetical protein
VTPRSGIAAFHSCDDQGSADQQIQAVTTATTASGFYMVTRAVDADNWIGVKCNDAGLTGVRFVTRIAGAIVERETAEHVPGDLVSIECSGSDVTFKINGSQIGSVYTDTNFTTETTQGFVNVNAAVSAGIFDDFEANVLAAPATDVVPDEFGVGQVFQRTPASSNASVTITGTYTGSPVSIECRILDAADDTTEIVSWTALDASPTGGVFSGAITVPEGATWLHAQVRHSDDTLKVGIQAQDWGVGMLAALWGQSNMENWSTDGAGVPNAALSYYRSSWEKKSLTGAGAIAFGNALIAEFGVVVGLIDGAVGGTSIAQWTDTSPASVYDDALQQIITNGGKVELVAWHQGEADAVAGTSEASYTTSLGTLVTTNMRASVTNGSDQTNLPFFMGQLGRRTNGTDATTQNIRSAITAFADGATADVYYAAEMYDLSLADTVHLTAAGYVTHATRYAAAVADIMGAGTFHRGPKISTGLLVNSTTVDVNISHVGGSDFFPTSAITGFEVFDDAAPITVSAAVRQSASSIRLTVTPAITGTATVRYMYGANPDITGVVLDNSSLNLPLEMAGDTVAVSEGESIVLDSGSYALTGTAIGINQSFAFPLDSGSYVLTGTALNFSFSYRIQVEPVSYSLTGTPIGITDTGNPWSVQPNVTTTWTIQG